MKKSLVFILFCFYIQMLIAQNVTIKGVAVGAGGKEIELDTKGDLISGKSKVIASTSIDKEANNFELRATISETMPVRLRIDNYVYNFYIEPNKFYDIKIDTFDYYKDEYVNPFLKELDLHTQLLNADKSDVNVMIAVYNEWLDNFITQFHDQIFILHKKEYLDTLNTWADIHFGKFEHPYFKVYKQYSIAEIIHSANFMGRLKLAETYLTNKDIYYNNDSYRLFFNGFFDNYLNTDLPKLTSKRIIKLLNSSNIYTILDSLGVDPALQDERIRELVFLKCMKTAYLSMDFKEDNIINLIRQFLVYTKFPEHKQIATDLIRTLPIGKEGTKIGNYKLTTVNNDTVDLLPFKQQYVLLIFYTSRCNQCMEDFETLRSLKVKFPNADIEYIAISCDKESVLFRHAEEDLNRYDWAFLYYANNKKLLHDLDIKTYPSYILLDKEGEVVQNPAPLPVSKQFISFLNSISQ